jgi:hypothetical protein
MASRGFFCLESVGCFDNDAENGVKYPRTAT